MYTNHVMYSFIHSFIHSFNHLATCFRRAFLVGCLEAMMKSSSSSSSSPTSFSAATTNCFPRWRLIESEWGLCVCVCVCVCDTRRDRRESVGSECFTPSSVRWGRDCSPPDFFSNCTPLQQVVIYEHRCPMRPD